MATLLKEAIQHLFTSTYTLTMGGFTEFCENVFIRTVGRGAAIIEGASDITEGVAGIGLKQHHREYLHAVRQPDQNIRDILDRSANLVITEGLQSHDILTPEQANRPCKGMDPHSLLKLLNKYTHTKRGMNYASRLKATLQEVCNGNISCDVGTIYSWFRLDAMGDKSWCDFSLFLDPRKYKPVKFSRLESGAEVIKSPASIYPSRIWDMYSNRVIPFQWFHEENRLRKLFAHCDGRCLFVAISHSWTADMVMDTKTPVNQSQYPVPLPAGIDLEDIRQEIRKLCGKEGQFCWLDVVCNRQKYVDDNHLPLPGWENCAEEGEKKRLLEWRTDLPVIGVIYEKAYQVVRYYNGLGRPFSSEGWESKRHWRNRVWTLQEVPCDDSYAGGIFKSNKTGGIHEGGEQFSLDMMCKNGSKYESARVLLKGSLVCRYPRGLIDVARIMDTVVLAAEQPMSWDDFQDVVREVNRRSCTTPRDRLIVLAYLSRCDPIPVYDENLTIEEMFHVVWQCFSKKTKANISGGMECKRPTWKGILDRLDAHPIDY